MNDASILTTGSLLPGILREAFRETGTSGIINIPGQTMVMVLEDFEEKDLEAFYGMANFRVALCKTFMLVSVAFKGFNFDTVWSPAIAVKSGEAILPAPAAQTHMLFSFILADGTHRIRGIRPATIAPNCSEALHRAQGELMAKDISDMDVYSEMSVLFAQYPGGFPGNFFHEICPLGA